MRSYPHISLVTGLTLFCSGALGARESDRVTALPGWPHALPSKQYSGFINVTGKEGVAPANEMMIHYYYIESEANAETDPLILWRYGMLITCVIYILVCINIILSCSY
jgi:hypothetical protein